MAAIDSRQCKNCKNNECVKNTWQQFTADSAASVPIVGSTMTEMSERFQQVRCSPFLSYLSFICIIYSSILN